MEADFGCWPIPAPSSSRTQPGVILGMQPPAMDDDMMMTSCIEEHKQLLLDYAGGGRGDALGNRWAGL